ncbi:MAG: HNH endonuclease [Telluria sp.]
MARQDGYVAEHRLLVAQAIGRPLTRTEVVHHIDHNATNNAIQNLMLFATNAEHKAFEHGAAIKPLWCGLCHFSTSGRSGVCVCRPGHLSRFVMA